MNTNFRWFTVAVLSAVAVLPVRAQVQVQNTNVRGGNGVNYVNRHGETGLAVPSRDPEALARAINTLLADEPLRARMGTAGRARVAAEFSVENMVQRHLRLYRALLAG